MTYLEFVRVKLGSNWVVARRTSRILARYGQDVVCISKQRLQAIDKEYRALYGDSQDKVRAQMYLALLKAKETFESCMGCRDMLGRLVLAQIESAIQAEQDRL